MLRYALAAQLLFAVLGCSSTGSDCACGGTNDCLALCMCSEGDKTSCELECAQSLPQQNTSNPSPEDEDRIGQLISLVNEKRAVGGCCEQACFEPMPELDAQEQLLSAAELHAADMIERDFISHDDPDGIDATTRIRRAGYRGCAVGENISVGDEDPEVVLDEFMNSYEHCLNVLEPRFLEVGVALARDENNEAFWVVTFGGH